MTSKNFLLEFNEAIGYDSTSDKRPESAPKRYIFYYKTEKDVNDFINKLKGDIEFYNKIKSIYAKKTDVEVVAPNHIKWSKET